MKIARKAFAPLVGAALLLAIMTPSLRSAEKAKLTVESPKLKAGEQIAADFTADGKDVSPPLAWKGVPAAAKQLALICDDPDAPGSQPWVHWVIYKIPAAAKGLPEAVAKDAELKSPPELAGSIQGLTGWKQPGYRGPAPPKGKPHHYHFKLYALDAALDLKPGLDKAALVKAIEGHVIGEGELVGIYERK